MDKSPLRLAPELGPEPEVEPTNVVELPRRAGDAYRRTENKLDSILSALDAQAKYGAEVETQRANPLPSHELAKHWAELKVREENRRRLAARKIALESAAGLQHYTELAPNLPEPHEWWEPNREVESKSNNGFFLLAFAGLIGGAVYLNRRKVKQSQMELDSFETQFDKRDSETIVSTVLGSAMGALPSMVRAEVQKAGASPVHKTTIVERVVNKAVPGAKGARGKAGRDGKDAKLSAKQTESIARKAIRAAEATALRELQMNPKKYRGQAGKDGDVYVEASPELPPRTPGVFG